MKTLIFSDTHLTDEFDQAKFDLLIRIISGADRVVINGDFWDGFQVTFDAFVLSEWQQLFPLLKEKETIYLEGNHDSFGKSDDRIDLFSTHQSTEYKLQWNDTVFHITHGHTMDPIFGSSENSRRFGSILKIYDYFDQLNSRWFKNVFGYLFWPKWLISFLLKRKVATFSENTILVVGHTHWPYFSLEKRFINCGAIMFGYASFLTIDDEDGIELHEEEYKA